MHLVSSSVVPLAEVPEGSMVRVLDTHIDAHSREQLRSLGVTSSSTVRVCKQGEPCVVQVRTTRIGISGSIARQLLVVVTADDARETPCR